MSKPDEYRVIVGPLPPADGGGFVARVPDLPGCLADGDTPSEALQNAYDAIACWIEAALENGRQIPEPSKHLLTA
jgi:predicted RNase H-like HicB family nuclease